MQPRNHDIYKQISGNDYHKGYDDGFKEGRDKGYDEGHDDGYETGYQEGRDPAYQEGVDYGHEQGYNAGYEEAVNTNQSCATEYHKGYIKGCEDTQVVPDLTEATPEKEINDDEKEVSG